jgi:hypothetical protein
MHIMKCIFKIVAYLFLGCTDSGGHVKFTPKYIIVGGEGGISGFLLRFQSYYFGNSGPHAKEEGGGGGGILLKVKATLASAEVSAGAVAKADQ